MPAVRHASVVSPRRGGGDDRRRRPLHEPGPRHATRRRAARRDDDLGRGRRRAARANRATRRAGHRRRAAFDPRGRRRRARCGAGRPTTLARARAVPSDRAARRARRREGQRRGRRPAGHGGRDLARGTSRVRTDAPLVARLRAAGMVVLAATNLSEWANIRSPRSTSGWSAVGGLTVNPYRLDRSAGGSSSGSGAAVAARLAPLAVGTETDGSITCPASLNGAGRPQADRRGDPDATASSRSRRARTAPDRWRGPSPTSRCSTRCSRASTRRRARVAAGADGLRRRRGDDAAHVEPGTDACFAAAIRALERAGATVADVAYPAAPGEVDDDELTVLLCELCRRPDRVPRGPRRRRPALARTKPSPTRTPTPTSSFATSATSSSSAPSRPAGARRRSYGPARERNLAWATATCLEPALATSTSSSHRPTGRRGRTT